MKVGDKVVFSKEARDYGLDNVKIQYGIVKRIMNTELIRVKRGSRVELWHKEFWRKAK